MTDFSHYVLEDDGASAPRTYGPERPTVNWGRKSEEYGN